MATNLGAADRVVRILLGIALGAIVYLELLPHGVPNVIAGVIGAYLLISGLLGRCIFYKMVDIDTSIQEQPYSTTDDRAGL